MKKTLKLCWIIFESPKAKLLCQNEVKKSKKKKYERTKNRTEPNYHGQSKNPKSLPELNSALAVMFNQAIPVATYLGRKRQMCSYIAKLDETWL